ncbi:MAG: hypothetical protein AB7R90_11970 [Reyranellaceae bacterium]
MLRGKILALGVLAMVAVDGAWAQQPPPTPTGSIRVQVNGHREVHGGPSPAKAEVTNLSSRDTRTVDISASGRADVGELPDGVYRVTIAPGDRMGATYVRVEGGKVAPAEFGAQGLPRASNFYASPEGLLTEAREAADRCDRAAYDAAVTELERQIATLEINLRDVNRLAEDYSKLTNLPPDLERVEKLYETILRAAFTGRSGPTGTAARRGAPVDAGLVNLPAFRAVLQEKARLEARLNQFRAARQQVPPFPAEKCAREAEKLFQRAALQFLIAPELSLVFLNRPQFTPFRLELAGIITKLGAFKPDDTDTGLKVGMSAGVRWDSSLLGTKQLGIEAKFWYVDYDMRGSGDVEAEPGGTIGLFSPATSGNPFGGYFTSGPLTGGQYRADVENYGGEVQFQTWLGSGNFRAMPWVGLRLGRTNVDEDMSFDIGNPAFTTFEQNNDIRDTYFGPTIGLKARVDIGGGLYAFGEGALALEYHRGKGDWRTFVPLVDAESRKDKLSSSKWGISASVKAGLGFEVGGFTAQFGAGLSYTNASPYLEYKDADSTTTGTGGADIGYGRQMEYFGEARLGWRF